LRSPLSASFPGVGAAVWAALGVALASKASGASKIGRALWKSSKTGPARRLFGNASGFGIRGVSYKASKPGLLNRPGAPIRLGWGRHSVNGQYHAVFRLNHTRLMIRGPRLE